MATDLTTIVVNWNAAELLDDCLNSILTAVPDGVSNEIIVVDNGSADGSVEHLARCWPRVRVICNAENVGFCRANNQAIRESESEFLLLVNTDARLHPGSVGCLLGYFKRDPRAAAVGPRLVYADGRFQRWTAGQLLELRSVANHFLGIDRLVKSRPGTAGIYLGEDTTVPFRPGWVSSAVMALRRSALDEIGSLDEQIFVYMDDVDLCQRAWDADWTVWYAADTTATHFMGSSSKGGASPEALRALNRWYARRHGRWSTTGLRLVEVLGFSARVAVYGVQYLTGGSSYARNQMQAHFTHLRLALEPIDV